jgi:acyl dehydratase
VRVGDPLPEVALRVTYSTVASVLGATWDGFPGHHDPEFARAQGQRDIYLNTFSLSGFLDRVALEWAGPEWFIRRRAMRMTGSVYPGDTLVGSGVVSETGTLDDGTPFVRLSLVASTEAAGPCVSSETTITLPPAIDER